MNTITVIEESLTGFSGKACLVQNEGTGEFFVVSSVMLHMADGDIETMAFRADAEGNVTDWLEVAGGPDQTTADVINSLIEGDLFYDHELSESLFQRSMFSDDEWDDFIREDNSLSDYEPEEEQ